MQQAWAELAASCLGSGSAEKLENPAGARVRVLTQDSLRGRRRIREQAADEPEEPEGLTSQK